MSTTRSRSQLLLLVMISAAGIALAALLGILVARTALSPIARFTRQTEMIAANPERIEHERLDVGGDDELARLGRTFNTTLDALERSVHRSATSSPTPRTSSAHRSPRSARTSS